MLTYQLMPWGHWLPLVADGDCCVPILLWVPLPQLLSNHAAVWLLHIWYKVTIYFKTVFVLLIKLSLISYQHNKATLKWENWFKLTSWKYIKGLNRHAYQAQHSAILARVNWKSCKLNYKKYKVNYKKYM